MGCTESALSRDGNTSVVRVLVLLALCMLIDVEACVEQPLSSLMPKVPAFARVLKTESPIAWERTFTWLGSFGGSSAKPTLLLSSASRVGELRRTKPAGPFKPLVKRKGKQVTGMNNRLAASAGYPENLGKAVASRLARRCLG